MASGKRNEQKARTRRRLMRQAFKLFSEKGLTATRTLDVARGAGVSHGTVFAHFQTRDELLAAVIEEFGHQITQRIHNLAGQGAGVKDVLAAHLKSLAENELFYTRLVMEGPLLPPEAGNTLIMIQSAISFHLFEAAQREMDQKNLRPIPMHLLFNTWIGLVHHYLVNRNLFAPSGLVTTRWGKELLDHYMSLITREKGEDV